MPTMSQREIQVGSDTVMAQMQNQQMKGAASTSMEMDEAPSKRQAMKGQWQTPPVGELFPSSAAAAAGSSMNIPVADLPVPSTSDDYAKALQEAYRRGAEAAAALTHGRQAQAQAPVTTGTGGTSTAPAAPIINNAVAAPSHPAVKNGDNVATNATNMGVPTPLPFLNSAPTESASMPTTTSVNGTGAAQPQAVPAASPVMTSAQSTMNVPINIDPTPVIPESISSTTAANPMTTDTSKILSSSRSVSMPNMTAMNDGNDEEAKRLKRLARNRASARLRRLRKKNLVESYETEVGVLETSLSKLQAHRWGVGHNTDALLEALSMDRGQQKIDSEKRKELITSILAQQREQVRNLLDCQLENMTLAWIAQHGEVAGTGAAVKDDPDTNVELDDLALELNRVLDLTPDQKNQLRSSSAGMEEERQAIEVIDQSLTALMSNSWLMNVGIEECTEKFTNILNPTQMSKFLLWADHNSEAIDQLDYVNAPPGNAPPSASPTFAFGIEEANAGEDG